MGKRKISWLLAVVLAALFCFPVLADGEELPLSPAVSLSPETPLPQESDLPEETPPGEPPYAFRASVRDDGGLEGTFPALSEKMEWISPCYSWDGETFYGSLDNAGEPWYWDMDWEYDQDGNLLEEYKKMAQTQLCATDQLEPMASYLAGEKDTFYIRLCFQIKGEEKIRESEVCRISRPVYDTAPEGTEWQANLDIRLYGPSSMRPPFPLPPPKYHVTVRKGTTPEELDHMLLKELPVTIWLCRKEDGVEQNLAQAVVDYPVKWVLPTEPVTQDISIPDAAGLTPPKDVTARTLDAVYHIAELPPVSVPDMLQGKLSEKITLVVNTVDADAKAAPKVYDYEGYLYADFPLKPTGVTGIVPFYSLDSGVTWTEGAPVELPNGSAEAFPKSADYTFVKLATAAQSPYKEYESGEIDGFLVRLEISGGVFEGQSEVLRFPTDYVPPGNNTDIGGSGGSGGNGGNAGSGNNSGDSSEAGQRPGLPADTPIPTEEPSPTPTVSTSPVPTPLPSPTAPPARDEPDGPADVPPPAAADSGGAAQLVHLIPPTSKSHGEPSPALESPPPPEATEGIDTTEPDLPAQTPVSQTQAPVSGTAPAPTSPPRTQEGAGAAALPLALGGAALIGGAAAAASASSAGGLSGLIGAIKRFFLRR